MIFIDKNEKDMIKDYLKSDFDHKFLKRWTMRVRKLLLPRKDQTPEIFKLISNNKQYKLIITHKEGNAQISKIYKIYRMIEKLNFTPKVVLKENNFILTEFLTGKFASFSDKNFEKNLGKMLSKLHSINRKKIKKENVLKQVKDFICNIKVIINLNDDVYREIADEMPEYLDTGLTYGDHNVGNYLWEDNELKLIDFGSFVYGDIIDIHLCSSPFFRKMNIKEFKKSYINNGGNNFIFKHFNLLKKIALLRSASYNFDRYKTSPFYDWRQVNDRIINVKNTLTVDNYFKNKIITDNVKNFYFPKNFLYSSKR
ncbi:aminoglycoside phosphotransferase family protein [Alphaproteobacteria bacterium]|nr:aminoglycoside phosphotransferase family protein [Alphaproteobacteria bacterium]